MNTLRFSLCLLLLAQAAVAPELQAQQEPPGTPTPSCDEVLVFSYIGPGAGSGITTYSATEMGANVAAYYDAEVDGFLYQGTGTTPIESGFAQGNPIAEGTMSASSAAALFALYSYHYLLPYSQDEETGEFLDPYGFAETSTYGIGASIVTGTADPDNYPTGETLYSPIYLGETWWQTYGVAPQINSINATCSSCAVPLTLGSSGTLTILGVYLTADGTDQTPTVNLSPMGQGLTLGSVTVVSDGELEVSYSVSSSPGSTGSYGITVTTNAGTSNTSNVKVGDPTPAITSISPNQWNANTTVNLTIIGTGFGTNPTLSMQGIGISFTYPCATSPGQQCDTQISATVTISASAPQQNVTITVTSNGYNGSGFLAAQGAQTGLTQGNAVVIPLPVVTPQIMLGPDASGTICTTGTNVAGSTQGVVVGQQVAFTGCIPSTPPGTTIASMSWSPTVPQGTAVGGYNVAADNSSASIVPLSLLSCGITTYCDFPKFYWVDQGVARQFTFSYTISTGQSASAMVAFNVAGPTATGAGGAFFTATPVGPASIKPGATQSLVLGANYAPYLTAGIQFSASATSTGLAVGTNASFVWVQLITKAQKNEGTSGGARVCVPNGFAQGQPNNTLPELDAYYPYPINPANSSSTNDSPGAALSSTAGALYELATYFKATMFLLWDPALPSGCMPALTDGTNNNVSTSSTCAQSIPVPLASAGWSFAADAINTLITQPAGLPDNATTWILGCDGQAQAGACVASVPSHDPNESFPVWYAISANGPRSTTNVCANN